MDTTTDRYAPLTAADRTNLNGWGRCYKLQFDLGLTRAQAARLAFLSLLVDHGLYQDDRRPLTDEEGA